MRVFKRFRKDERGSAPIWVAFCLLIFFMLGSLLQCHQLKDATTLKAPKGRHKTGPLFQQIHAQIGARILGDSAN